MKNFARSAALFVLCAAALHAQTPTPGVAGKVQLEAIPDSAWNRQPLSRRAFNWDERKAVSCFTLRIATKEVSFGASSVPMSADARKEAASAAGKKSEREQIEEAVAFIKKSIGGVVRGGEESCVCIGSDILRAGESFSVPGCELAAEVESIGRESVSIRFGMKGKDGKLVNAKVEKVELDKFFSL